MKDGPPDLALSSVINTYSLFLFRDVLVLCGTSFALYVCKGNLSKTRLTGVGSLHHCHGVLSEGALNRTDFALAFVLSSSSVSPASLGILIFHPVNVKPSFLNARRARQPYEYTVRP